jgi:hypothetical protein
VCAHHDQVGALPRGGFEDYISWISHSYVEVRIGGMGDFVGPCFGGELTKCWLGLSVHKIEAEPQSGRVSQQGIDRAEDGQAALSSSSESLGPPQGMP